RRLAALALEGVIDVERGRARRVNAERVTEMPRRIPEDDPLLDRHVGAPGYEDAAARARLDACLRCEPAGHFLAAGQRFPDVDAGADADGLLDRTGVVSHGGLLGPGRAAARGRRRGRAGRSGRSARGCHCTWHCRWRRDGDGPDYLTKARI